MTNKENWVEIGFGQEARAFKGNPTEIEGMPIIKSNPTSMIVRKPMVIVKRVDWEEPIYDYQGHDLFCRHLTARLLEELFLKEGKYQTEHIPIPLGSFNDKKAGYYYEFVEGSEAFPSDMYPDEWNSFVGLFYSFGFDVSHDTTEAGDGRVSKNVILGFPGWNIKDKDGGRIPHSNWKRIDFGRSSFLFNYEKFEAEMLNNETYLSREMGQNYRLALLSAKYYNTMGKMPQTKLEKLEGMTELEELEGMILQFRKRYIL